MWAYKASFKNKSTFNATVSRVYLTHLDIFAIISKCVKRVRFLIRCRCRCINIERKLTINAEKEGNILNIFMLVYLIPALYRLFHPFLMLLLLLIRFESNHFVTLKCRRVTNSKSTLHFIRHGNSI